MRVLICPDRIGPLSSLAAGTALAEGWPSAETLPLGEAGAGFIEATAAAWGEPVRSGMLADSVLDWVTAGESLAVGLGSPGESAGLGWGMAGAVDRPIPYQASSRSLGQAIASLLAEHRPRRLLVDLAGPDVHDAGAGMLAGLGATGEGARLDAGVAGLAGLSGVDLDPARRLLAGIELTGVVPSRLQEDRLLGLRGVTSRRGRAAGEDLARLLAADAALKQLTDLVAPEPAAEAGAGACGGLGWAVRALGGRLATGPGLALERVAGPYDLVVTGCTAYDFATRGGGVVAAAAARAADWLAPCIVIAGEVLIGSREMRTMGIEAAYPIRDPGPGEAAAGELTARELGRTAVRVSRTWRW